MIDLHTHILPGIDDGAAGFDEAVAMCRRAAATGTEAVVATPHLLHPRWGGVTGDGLRESFKALVEVLGGFLDVRLGAEIHVGSDLLELVDRLPAGPLVRLAGSRYLLLELPFVGRPPDVRMLVHEIMLAGWVPVLAHPERTPCLIGAPAELDDLVDLGALLQVTAMSLTGGFGRKVMHVSRELVDRGLAHFVASDGHDPELRPAVLDEAFAVVRQGWGESAAQQLFADNPMAVLEDRPLASRVPRGAEAMPRMMDGER